MLISQHLADASRSGHPRGLRPSWCSPSSVGFGRDRRSWAPRWPDPLPASPSALLHHFYRLDLRLRAPGQAPAGREDGTYLVEPRLGTRCHSTTESGVDAAPRSVARQAREPRHHARHPQCHLAIPRLSHPVGTTPASAEGVVGSARGAWCRAAWPTDTWFPPAAHRTVHAVLPHTAHRRSSPLAFSSPAPRPVGRGATMVPVRSISPMRSVIGKRRPTSRTSLRWWRLAMNHARRFIAWSLILSNDGDEFP